MKDTQLDLLLPSAEERIEAALLGPCLFFFVREVADILLLTEAQVRWAIKWYRLDSLLVGNQYRIPRTALEDFWTHRQELRRQDVAYQLYIKRRELRAPGNQLSIHSPLTKEVFRSDDGPEAQEPTLQDWYNLWALPLPYEAVAEDWARILRSPTACITKDLEVGPKETLEWPDIYDWMISRELVNLPVGVDAQDECLAPRKSPPVPPTWQMLFEGFYKNEM